MVGGSRPHQPTLNDNEWRIGREGPSKISSAGHRLGEWIAVPDLGIDPIKAKVGTGARSSSLHAYDIRRFKRRGISWVRFRVHPVQRNHRVTVEARKTRWVRAGRSGICRLWTSDSPVGVFPERFATLP